MLVFWQSIWMTPSKGVDGSQLKNLVILSAIDNQINWLVISFTVVFAYVLHHFCCSPSPPEWLLYLSVCALLWERAMRSERCSKSHFPVSTSEWTFKLVSLGSLDQLQTCEWLDVVKLESLLSGVVWPLMTSQNWTFELVLHDKLESWLAMRPSGMAYMTESSWDQAKISHSLKINTHHVPSCHTTESVT